MPSGWAGDHARLAGGVDGQAAKAMDCKGGPHHSQLRGPRAGSSVWLWVFPIKTLIPRWAVWINPAYIPSSSSRETWTFLCRA